MKSITEHKAAQSFLDEYINKPIITPTIKEAYKKLIKLGILSSDGEIAPEYKNIIHKVN